MKVLFVFNGLPHYYIPIFNRLNSVPGIEIHVVIPAEISNISIGKGVHQSMDGVRFKVHHLKEYKELWGKAFFKGIISFLQKEKPEIIVTGWPYILGFIFNPIIFLFLKIKGIKIINKLIPYNIPMYNEAIKFYTEKKGALTEEMQEEDVNKIMFKIKYYLLRWVLKTYFKLVDAHVNYIEEAFEILGSYGVSRKKIFIIYNSPDTEIIFKAIEKIKNLSPVLPLNKFRIIHVGRLVKWKKVDMLIHVFTRLKEKFQQAELVIIGSGPEENNLKSLANKLHVDNNVLFTGGVYDLETLGRYYISSGIFVLVGVGGLAINEAMCFSKPIVCSVGDGTEKKLVREDYNGKYFKNGDTEDLYDKLLYLFNNPAVIKKMGENSLKIVQEEVNEQVVIRGYVEAFNFVMKTNQFAH